MEMIKGIKGHGYHDELVIPIIENTPYEYELTDSLSEAVCYQTPIFQSSFFLLGRARDMHIIKLRRSLVQNRPVQKSNGFEEHKDLNTNSLHNMPLGIAL